MKWNNDAFPNALVGIFVLALAIGMMAITVNPTINPNTQNKPSKILSLSCDTISSLPMEEWNKHHLKSIWIDGLIVIKVDRLSSAEITSLKNHIGKWEFNNNRK